MDLTGKVAVVTGAASGIGRALVRRFSDEGMRVVAADVDEVGLAATVDGLDDALRRRCDVADPDDVESLAAFTYDRFGATHVLCNNAGVFQAGNSWECEPADWEWCFGVNVYGIVNGYRAFIPRMLEAGEWGHVVNTASVAAFIVGPSAGPYTVSKVAALSLSETLAREMEGLGANIGVSCLTPAATDTGIARSARNRPPGLVAEQTPTAIAVEQGLGALVEGSMPPADVADAVVRGIQDQVFLIAPKDSVDEQIRTRFEALLRREAPGATIID